jgi:hypothetical protein
VAAFSNFPPTFFDFFLNAAKRLHSIDEESVDLGVICGSCCAFSAEVGAVW